MYYFFESPREDRMGYIEYTSLSVWKSSEGDLTKMK